MRADWILTLCFAVLFGVAFWEGASYRWQSGLGILLVCGTGFALSCGLGLAMLRSPVRASATVDWDDAKLLLWLWAAIAAVMLFGFMYGGGGFVFAYMIGHIEGPKRWRTALLSAIAVAVVVEGLFDELLGLTLYPGLVFT